VTSTDNWRSVWDRKGADAGDVSSDLECLLRADGFDTGYSRVTTAAWAAQVARVLNRLGADAGNTIYEVGCGAGAFLFPIYERGLTVAGSDYSPSQVATAAKAMPQGQFEICEARLVPNLPQYDFVVAFGVFHYFPDLEYAQEVITAMAAKGSHGVAILDIPDIAHKDACLSLRYQVEGSKEAYEEKYRGLHHQFYDREWLVSALQKAGTFSVDVQDQKIEEYANAASRFNVIARRA
jgi:SAM-dependent methyltransferase